MEDKIKEAIKSLSEKSKDTEQAIEAQQYTQSVLNLSNALSTIKAEELE